MKIKPGYVLRTVAGCSVVVPVGSEALNFNGMINLNESGALLWKTLADGADEAALLSALMAEYDVSEEVAQKDVAAFIKTISDAGLTTE